MLDLREIEIEIARLEYGESSYPAYQKLANLYTIRNQMHQRADTYDVGYSSALATESIEGYGESEFLQAIAGKDPAAVWAIMDDLMDTLQVTNPRAYAGIMRRIAAI